LTLFLAKEYYVQRGDPSQNYLNSEILTWNNDLLRTIDHHTALDWKFQKDELDSFLIFMNLHLLAVIPVQSIAYAMKNMDF
jgi:hypothetical protein